MTDVAEEYDPFEEFNRSSGMGIVENPYPMFALLRARTAAFEAEQAYSQQEIAQALARARLNQAQGVLP